MLKVTLGWNGLNWIITFIYYLENHPCQETLSFNFKKHFWVKRWKRIMIWSLPLKDLNLRLSVSSTKVGSSKVFWTVNEQKISEKRLQICNFNGYGFTTGSLVGILRNILSFYRKLLLKYAVMIKLTYAFCFYFCIFIFFFKASPESYGHDSPVLKLQSHYEYVDYFFNRW